jgi:hypothetical protein
VTTGSMWRPAAWTGLLPTSLLARWPGLAPENLEQRIQSGVFVGSTINVTELNSAAPDTEAAILQTKSYGRQLGKVSDALHVLIEERKKAGGAKEQALDEFSAMKADIDRVKGEAAESRGIQLRKDLEALRRENADEYERLRTELLGGALRSGNGHPQP